MIASYKVKSILEESGFDITRVEIAGFELSLNQVFKVFTRTEKLCFKLYNDHPMGYYKVSRDRLELIMSCTRELALEFPFIQAPIQILKTSAGYAIIWPWIDLFSNNEPNIDALKCDKIKDDELLNQKLRYFNLGTALLDIHNHLSDFDIEPKDEQLYFKSLHDRINEITNIKKQEGFFSNVSSESFHNIQNLMRRWLEELSSHNLDQLKKTWIHRDIHPRNFRFNDNELGSIIDWDHLSFDFAILDMLGSIRHLTGVNNTLAFEFLRGYVKDNPFNPKIVEFLLLGMSFTRALNVIAGGIWQDDIIDMKYELYGKDKALFELILEFQLHNFENKPN